MTDWYSTVSLYHTLYIHLLCHGPLSSSHLPMIMIVQLWISMYKFQFEHVLSMLWGVYVGVELLVHMVSICLTFWESAKLFPQQLHHFTFPSATCECFHFSTASPTFVIFYYSHPGGCEVVCHCGLDLHFPDDREHFFHVWVVHSSHSLLFPVSEFIFLCTWVLWFIVPNHIASCLWVSSPLLCLSQHDRDPALFNFVFQDYGWGWYYKSFIWKLIED